MSDPLPRVHVKVKAGPTGPIQTFIDGVDVSDLLLREPFEIRFAPDPDEETYVVVGLPVSELDLELTDVVLNAVAVDDVTGEVA